MGQAGFQTFECLIFSIGPALQALAGSQNDVSTGASLAVSAKVCRSKYLERLSELHLGHRDLENVVQKVLTVADTGSRADGLLLGTSFSWQLGLLDHALGLAWLGSD